MKKTLLMLVAFMATMTAFASAEEEGWQKSFTPVASADDLDGVHTAVASDGSVFASSTYNQTFTLGDVTVADPEGLTSSCVLKFDKDGNAKWAVTLLGKCYVHAMAADTDGTLYVAGQSQDIKVVATGTDGKHYEIDNPTSDPWGEGPEVAGYSAFILKITKDGLVDAVKVMSPITEPDIATAEFPMYIALDILSIQPYQLKIDGDKIYMSARYTGTLKEGNDQTIWMAAYVIVDGFMRVDNTSMGVLSLDKAGLTNIYSEAIIQSEDILTAEKQYYPEAVTFFVKENVVNVAFIGFGNLYVHGRNGGRSFNFQTTDDESGNKEHGLVFLNNSTMENKIYHAEMHNRDAVPYNLTGGEVLGGDKVFIGGTFYGNFPLTETVEPSPITKTVNTAFFASLEFTPYTFGVNWSWVNDAESQATCMVVTGEEIHAATTAAMYTLKTANGELKDTMEQGFEDASSYNDQYVSTIFTKDNSVTVFSPKLKPSGINSTKAAMKNANAKFYNVNGMELAAPQKGLNIIKTDDGVKKVSVK